MEAEKAYLKYCANNMRKYLFRIVNKNNKITSLKKMPLNH